VPLRRVNQAYVIATSTTADVSGVKLPAALAGGDRVAESNFFKADVSKPAKGRAGFFEAQVKADAKKAGEASAERKAAQAAVDGGIKLSAGGKDLTAYLKATFALSKGDKPHEMKF
jgi:large subunit ribosomal protein L6e